MGIKPNKGLSQHFLIDSKIVKKMVEGADVQQRDTIIDIGAGFGVLTKACLAKGATVIAIEKDKKLAAWLHRLYNERLKVIVDDFRNISLAHLLTDTKRVKVIANIPYHLTGYILQKLVPNQMLIQSLHLIVQQEVAKRCTAVIKTKNYTSFTLFIHYHTYPKLLFSIPKTSFYPQPNVESAILELKLKKSPIHPFYDPLFQMIRCAFQMRRKMLRVSLKKIASSTMIEEALTTLNLPKISRPQELTFTDFSALFHILHAKKGEKGESDYNT